MKVSEVTPEQFKWLQEKFSRENCPPYHHFLDAIFSAGFYNNYEPLKEYGFQIRSLSMPDFLTIHYHGQKEECKPKPAAIEETVLRLVFSEYVGPEVTKIFIDESQHFNQYPTAKEVDNFFSRSKDAGPGQIYTTPNPGHSKDAEPYATFKGGIYQATHEDFFLPDKNEELLKGNWCNPVPEEIDIPGKHPSELTDIQRVELYDEYRRIQETPTVHAHEEKPAKSFRERMAEKLAENPCGPLIGIMPRDSWEKQRIAAIIEAIDRYTAAKTPVPIAWFEELRELSQRNYPADPHERAKLLNTLMIQPR